MFYYREYVNALRRCAKEHEKDFTGTGCIRVSDLCNDTADLLESLEKDENYLKRLAEKQTQIKELAPDSLKENEYIQGDLDHNVQVALKKLKEVYWKNNLTIEDKKKFAKAQDIIIYTLVFGDYDIVRKK